MFCFSDVTNFKLDEIINFANGANRMVRVGIQSCRHGSCRPWPVKSDSLFVKAFVSQMLTKPQRLCYRKFVISDFIRIFILLICCDILLAVAINIQDNRETRQTTVDGRILVVILANIRYFVFIMNPILFRTR